MRPKRCGPRPCRLGYREMPCGISDEFASIRQLLADRCLHRPNSTVRAEKWARRAVSRFGLAKVSFGASACFRGKLQLQVKTAALTGADLRVQGRNGWRLAALAATDLPRRATAIRSPPGRGKLCPCAAAQLDYWTMVGRSVFASTSLKGMPPRRRSACRAQLRHSVRKGRRHEEPRVWACPAFAPHLRPLPERCRRRAFRARG
jgi:hypothetical protein